MRYTIVLLGVSLGVLLVTGCAFGQAKEKPTKPEAKVEKDLKSGLYPPRTKMIDGHLYYYRAGYWWLHPDCPTCGLGAAASSCAATVHHRRHGFFKGILHRGNRHGAHNRGCRAS